MRRRFRFARIAQFSGVSWNVPTVTVRFPGNIPGYYDPTKYKTYLEQLGIKYPTVRDTTKTVP